MRFSGRGGEICRHPFSCPTLPPRRRCNDPCRRAAFGRTVKTYIACMGAVQPPYRLDMSSKRPCWHAGYRSAILSPGIFIFPLIGRVHYHFAAVGRKERYSELIGAHLFRYTQEIHTSEAIALLRRSINITIFFPYSYHRQVVFGQSIQTLVNRTIDTIFTSTYCRRQPPIPFRVGNRIETYITVQPL
mgnify:CR=1 FL=1